MVENICEKVSFEPGMKQ